jgi:hypothetical protein
MGNPKESEASYSMLHEFLPAEEMLEVAKRKKN